MCEHIIKVVFTHTARKTTVIDISDLIVRQTFVLHASGNLVIRAEIIILYFGIEVGRIIFIPSPVTRHIKRRDQVGMPIFYLGQHLAEDIKQFVLIHRIFNKQIVAVVHLVPVDILESKEAIVLVHDMPKRLEIITGGRIIFRCFLTTEKKEETEGKEKRSQS